MKESVTEASMELEVHTGVHEALTLSGNTCNFGNPSKLQFMGGPNVGYSCMHDCTEVHRAVRTIATVNSPYYLCSRLYC